MVGPHRTTRSPAPSRDPDYKTVNPPRPANAWILYRSHKSAELRSSEERMSQGNVSRVISHMWKNEDEATKQFWERKAEDAKHQHSAKYPDYHYRPRKKEEKQREKEDRKNQRTQRARRSRTTPPDTDQSPPPALPAPHQPPSAPSHPNPAMPLPPTAPYMPQSTLIPTFNPNAFLEQYNLHAASHGPWGPSPPISAAPSPSPEPQPCPSGLSSRSASGSVPSPDSGLQEPSSFSQLPANQYYPSLPVVQNPYAPPLLPVLPYPLVENTAWTGQLPIYDYQNTELNIYKMRTQQYQNAALLTQLSQASSYMDPYSGVLVTRDGNNAFDMSTIGTNNLLAHPGDGDDPEPATAPLECTDDVFQFVDFNQPEQQDALPALASEEPDPIYQTPHNPDIQEYPIAHQHQPDLYTHQMMNYMPLEATSPAVPSLPTTVDPQLMHVQGVQHTVPTPPFAQMTNVPTVAAPPHTSYVPPAGAIYSANRRVAASWKAPLPSPLQIEEPTESWYTN